MPPPEAWPPLVVASRQNSAQRVIAVNAAAARLGLEVGLALAQAQAMCPALIVRPHNAAEDASLLARLADWLDRYTPLVARTPPDGLMLDVTGASHLVGGERALVDEIAERLARQGFAVRLALAGTPGAARAVARHGQSGAIIASGEEFTALAPLPVAALRVDTDIAAGLARAGLKTIGDLTTRPRAPLAARFGPLLLHRLDQALGIDVEAIDPRAPVPPAQAELRLAEPIVREADVATVVLHLARQLCADLEARGEGARHIKLTVFRVDGVVRTIEVRLADASRDPAVLHGLLVLRLKHLEDPLDPGYGFDHIRLSAPLTGPWSPTAQAMPLDGIPGPSDVAADARRLADRLAARFGPAAVLRLVPVDTHVPEEMASLIPIARIGTAAERAAPERDAGVASETVTSTGIGPLRPLRLFDPPEPVDIIAEVPDGPPLRLRWRKRSLNIAAAEGPERIALPWWSSANNRGGFTALPRDYYRVADETGRRLWIFREGPYAPPPAAPPRWYVHGLFG